MAGKPGQIRTISGGYKHNHGLKSCGHKECDRCSRMSVSRSKSDQYVCHKCLDLHPRRTEARRRAVA